MNMMAARPIWPEGREREMNRFVGFRAVFEAPGDALILRVAASSVYRAFLNGEFIGHGPARAARGFFRADEWELRPRPGRNVVALEVAGYNVNGYALLDQASFLQAELVFGERVLAATGAGGATAPFEAALLDGRVQKVERYSYQRPFSEVYRLAPGFDAWRCEPAAAFEPTGCAVLSDRRLLARGVPRPDFALRRPVRRAAEGTIERGVKPEVYWRGRSLTERSPTFKRFPEAELDVVPSLELQEVRSVLKHREEAADAAETFELAADTFQILDFGTNLTGFIGVELTCRAPTRLLLTFDELLTEGDVDWTRLGCINLVDYHLAPGSYHLETFEPYTLRYLKLMVFDGDCTVGDVTLRELANPEAGRARLASGDERLAQVFEAGRETFRQNAVDLFMDCPSRERAGWLCDSFFAARAAFALCGNTAVERNFLENFLLPDRFDDLPAGMLPMCYPADHPNGQFIPNWAMWFVLELEEYLGRSGDRALVDALRPRVLALLDYLERFENTDGLLEKLESWVFVEWSKANDFVQDVNYPSNALYAGALDAAGRLYGRAELCAKAERTRRTVRRQAFNGAFFVDNAVRRNGELVATNNTTETCQYYLFYFGVASPETDPDLWRTLLEHFGPTRDASAVFPDVHPSNAFIGNVLRLELLSRHGLCARLLDEAVGYHLYMAERTGTLWEMKSDDASCNHGFASQVCHVFFRDILGVHRIDPVARRISLRFCDLPLERCEGRVPVGDEAVVLSWESDGAGLRYSLVAPAGYDVDVVNATGRPLVRV